jgi:hypothetical protein
VKRKASFGEQQLWGRHFYGSSFPCWVNTGSQRQQSEIGSEHGPRCRIGPGSDTHTERAPLPPDSDVRVGRALKRPRDSSVAFNPEANHPPSQTISWYKIRPSRQKLLEVSASLGSPLIGNSAQISGSRKAKIGCASRRKHHGRNTDIALMIPLEFPVEFACKRTYYAHPAAL